MLASPVALAPGVPLAREPITHPFFTGTGLRMILNKESSARAGPGRPAKRVSSVFHRRSPSLRNVRSHMRPARPSRATPANGLEAWLIELLSKERDNKI